MRSKGQGSAADRRQLRNRSGDCHTLRQSRRQVGRVTNLYLPPFGNLDRVNPSAIKKKVEKRAGRNRRKEEIRESGIKAKIERNVYDGTGGKKSPSQNEFSYPQTLIISE